MAGLNKAIADAQKIVGKEGKIPKFTDLFKELAAVSKVADDLGIDAFKAKLLAYKKALDSARDTIEAHIDDVKTDDFGLDPKDAKQKKQIKDAQDVLLDCLQEQEKKAQVLIKVMDDGYKNINGMHKEFDDLSAA